ncbi:MAG: anthranilate synthase component I family protein [Spirochaetes bacterium]|nr:MAG: anthranilate synthase component I family protein [Spirochaetota bacterium]
MMYPSLSTVTRLARRFNRIPVYREMNISEPGMLMLLRSLQSQENVVFLESAHGRGKPQRFSFLGIHPRRLVRCVSPGEVLVSEGGREERLEINFFDYMKARMAEHRAPHYPRYGDFNGGYAGYMGFGLVNHCGIMRAPVKENAPHPLAMFHLIDDFIVHDGRENCYHAATCIDTEGGEPIALLYERACARLEMIERETIARIVHTRVPCLPLRADADCLAFRDEPARFMEKVARARELIGAGEALQVVLSMRADITERVDPFLFYLRLRRLNPSPYMFFLKFGDLVVTGSSPEIHVKVKNGKAVLKPIAGTIRQGEDRAESARNKAALLADPKERAEHLMLVDLARNDLARISAAGSVRVTRFMEPEDYSHVIHLVSLVESGLRPRTDAVDVLRETFPAGTVSGAPKVRALEIIDELEDHARGIYAGAVGYLGFNGHADTCITIRTAVFSPEESYLQAGAGIVYDSVPENEYREIRHKLAALAASLPFGRTQEDKEELACSV